ncbi:MAG: ABC transporter substrate-binding protein [Symploca sp. SIO2B6]|nr:ABC transporter substrate-binding protein [Symploca sp. SIO2B6]
MNKPASASSLNSNLVSRKFKRPSAMALAITISLTGLLSAACQDTTNSSTTGEGGLKLGTLTPSTGDLASIGAVFPDAVRLAVDQVNACGGVNEQSVELIVEDSQTDPNASLNAMTKLTELDRVAGVIGAFASSVSTAALPIAVRNKVMMISPGSTSPVFTQQAQKGEFKGYWARTAPPDTYQARALAKLANQKGFKRVSTAVINNDYGVGFEQEFIAAFEKLGGTVVNKNKPTRYDPKAATFDSEAASAFGTKPEAVAAVLYAETGSLLLKSAYQQGLATGVTVMLTDGVKSEDFAAQVGKNRDGKFLLAGAIGTVPGANGKGLENFTKLWTEKTSKELTPFVPHSYDAAALMMLAAEAADANTGEGIKSKVLEISNAPGKEVTDLCEAMELVRNGEEINYQGASSNVDIDQNGDVIGDYDIWTVKSDGKLDVTGTVSPET